MHFSCHQRRISLVQLSRKVSTMSTILRSTFTLAAVACAALGSATVLAQAYPGKPVRLITPAAFGSGPDINARLLMIEVSKHLGQPVVVENLPGADSIIGLEKLARAAPDGYTLGLAPATFYTNPSVYANLPYDSAKDFVPVGPASRVPFYAGGDIVVANPLAEGTDRLRASEPGQVIFFGGEQFDPGFGIGTD
ncbi:MAG: hypothetical protein EXR28_07850 [Betaproteobacteria bacterium]|nr:hypothetical protein [Betaproteobacteria bacterium]